MNRICDKCGTENSGNGTACYACLSRLPPASDSSLPPVPCSACVAAIEESELRWVKCGGLSVGTYRQPMVWRLRDKYSSDVIKQNAKYSQRLAAAARLVHALKDHITDHEMLERMEKFLK